MFEKGPRSYLLLAPPGVNSPVDIAPSITKFFLFDFFLKLVRHLLYSRLAQMGTSKTVNVGVAGSIPTIDNIFLFLNYKVLAIFVV